MKSRLNYINNQIVRIKTQIAFLEKSSLFTDYDREILKPKYVEELEKFKKRKKEISNPLKNLKKF